MTGHYHKHSVECLHLGSTRLLIICTCFNTHRIPRRRALLSNLEIKMISDAELLVLNGCQFERFAGQRAFCRFAQVIPTECTFDAPGRVCIGEVVGQALDLSAAGF